MGAAIAAEWDDAIDWGAGGEVAAAGEGPATPPSRLADLPWIAGDRYVKVAPHVVVVVTAGFAFVGGTEARRALGFLGQPDSERTVGVLASRLHSGEQWHLVIEWHPVGYVDPAAAVKWSAAGPRSATLLRTMAAVAAIEGARLAEAGVLPTSILGWRNRPRYTPGEVPSIGWTTVGGGEERRSIAGGALLLYRHGYLRLRSVELVSPREDPMWVVDFASKLVRVEPGHQHGDYAEGADPVAPATLRAYITGEARLSRGERLLVAGRVWLVAIAAGAAALLGGWWFLARRRRASS
jgi:uncharacterized membrane-anchored protein